MSLERVLKMLEGFGLSSLESEVYVCLAKTGPSKAKDLCNELKMTKQQLYPTLKGLERKGIVFSKPEHSALFNALAFEELLTLHVRLNLDQAQIISETKEELLASWRNATENRSS